MALLKLLWLYLFDTLFMTGQFFVGNILLFNNNLKKLATLYNLYKFKPILNLTQF